MQTSYYTSRQINIIHQATHETINISITQQHHNTNTKQLQYHNSRHHRPNHNLHTPITAANQYPVPPQNHPRQLQSNRPTTLPMQHNQTSNRLISQKNRQHQNRHNLTTSQNKANSLQAIQQNQFNHNHNANSAYSQQPTRVHIHQPQIITTK